MTVAVIGAGTMGAGIADAFAAAGRRVELADPDGGRAAAAAAAIAARHGVAPRVVTDVPELTPGAEVVVEAVPEDTELKRRVLARAEALEPALVATNTSALSIGALAEALAEPERFCGMHFFNPVHSSRLVEIVVGPRTAPAARDHARRLAEELGKETVVVRDAPGFATSRLGVLLGLEAIRMLEEGVASAEDIDRAMVLGYKHPIGPLRLTDLVGLDVRLAIARSLAPVHGERFAPPRLLESMVEAGRLGRKSGQGFYAWDGAA